MSGEDSGTSDANGDGERAAAPQFDGDLADLEAENAARDANDAPTDADDGDDDTVDDADSESVSGGAEPEREAASEQEAESDRSEPDRETVELAVRSHLLSAWQRQADQAKLSLSAYLVHMVEAGRMSVTMQPAVTEDTQSTMTAEEVADHIREELEHDEYVSWDELVETFVDDLERTVEDALSDLQDDGVVRYSGLHGGYQLTDREE